MFSTEHTAQQLSREEQLRLWIEKKNKSKGKTENKTCLPRRSDGSSKNARTPASNSTEPLVRRQITRTSTSSAPQSRKVSHPTKPPTSLEKGTAASQYKKGTTNDRRSVSSSFSYRTSRSANSSKYEHKTPILRGRKNEKLNPTVSNRLGVEKRKNDEGLSKTKLKSQPSCAPKMKPKEHRETITPVSIHNDRRRLSTGRHHREGKVVIVQGFDSDAMSPLSCSLKSFLGSPDLTPCIQKASVAEIETRPLCILENQDNSAPPAGENIEDISFEEKLEADGIDRKHGSTEDGTIVSPSESKSIRSLDWLYRDSGCNDEKKRESRDDCTTVQLPPLHSSTPASLQNNNDKTFEVVKHAQEDESLRSKIDEVEACRIDSSECVYETPIAVESDNEDEFDWREEISPDFISKARTKRRRDTNLILVLPHSSTLVNDEAIELEVVQNPLDKNEKEEEPEEVLLAECEKTAKENTMDEANTNNKEPANDKEGQNKYDLASSLPPIESSGPFQMPQSPASLESEQSNDPDNTLIDGEISGHDEDTDKSETETMRDNHIGSVDDQEIIAERGQKDKFDWSGVSPPGCFPIEQIRRRDDPSFLLLPQPSPASEHSSDIEEAFADMRYAVSVSTSDENDEGRGLRGNIGEIPTVMSSESTSSVTSSDEGQNINAALDCSFEGQYEDFDLEKLNSVVRVDEKTVLESIREQSEGLSIDTETDVRTCENCQPLINDLRWQLNCLMVEKKKLEDHVHSYRKGYEGQVTPFRNVFVDVSYCSDGELLRSISMC
jgi:hypothetical protein